jgi:hypothetical protein
MIKKFADFVSESIVNEKTGDSYSKGCVMAYLEDLIPLVTGLHAKISPDDVYEEKGDRTYGLEDEPHVTVLYGIHSSEVSEKEVLDLIGGLDWHQPVVVGTPSLFENEKYDVLKLSVNAEWLKDANKRLCDNLPYSNDYPDYTAHVTIAYLKPGRGKDVVESLGEVKEKVVPNKMVYSLPNGEKRILNEGELNETFFKTQYKLNGPQKPANFGVSINGLKVQFIPSSSKDLDNLEGTDVKEELQKWLDHKFGKEMMLPDFQFEGAGYGFIISDKLIDSAIGKYLKA